MTAAGTVYCVALLAFAAALHFVWGEEPSRTMHEHLFWGGGHVLQFLYCLLMLTGWYVLAEKSLGKSILDPEVFALATRLIAVFAVPALLFYLIFEPFSFKQTEAFRRLQFVLAFPSLLIAVGGLNAVLAYRRRQALPWHDPGFVALVLSAIVFAAGGVMGLLITTSDTRTPAHYHGVIAGVNLACMGLMLTYCLPLLERAPAARTRLRLQIILFGLGQLMASIGLFLAGGYGAPRKMPSGSVNLVDGAVLGLYLHGAGALFAVIGGVLFVLTLFRALLTRPEPVASRRAAN
jgi:heme/copper-type cytochrome/quinol oxidase subunit 1